MILEKYLNERQRRKTTIVLKITIHTNLLHYNNCIIYHNKLLYYISHQTIVFIFREKQRRYNKKK